MHNHPHKPLLIFFLNDGNLRNSTNNNKHIRMKLKYFRNIMKLITFISIFENSVRFWPAIIIFLLRLAALIWVIKDANARSSSFRFQLLSIFLVIAFTPIIWILLYIAIRPQWWKRDKTPRRDTTFQKIQICDNCWEFNQINHLYCTSCWESLHVTCRECQNKFSNSYSYCPYCWAPRLEE